MKVWSKIAIAGGMVALLAGCGERVEVGSAELGKVMTQQGYQEGVTETSKFRLNSCWWPGAVCDRLVVLDVSDRSVTEDFDLYMPADKLSMEFRLGVTLGVKRSGVEELFNKIPPNDDNGRVRQISINRAYQTYAQRIIRAETRSFLTDYSIMEISNNRDVIGAQLFEHLKENVERQTPFNVIYAGLDNVAYPSIIINAQERAAERREQIQQEEAQLEISRVQLQRQLEEQQLQRRIEVERAESEREVNQILAESVTPTYETYRMLEALDSIAKSDNTKFLPVEMLGSMATQVMLGNEK